MSDQAAYMRAYRARPVSVYVISADGDLHKVGMAADVHVRRSQLQREHPEKLEVVFSVEVPMAAQVEQYAHWILREDHVVGEWFAVDGELAVAAVREAVAAVAAGKRERFNCAGVGRPPRSVKRVTVSVRFEPDEITAIDAARGDITRQAFIALAAISGLQLSGVIESQGARLRRLTGQSRPLEATGPGQRAKAGPQAAGFVKRAQAKREAAPAKRLAGFSTSGAPIYR